MPRGIYEKNNIMKEKDERREGIKSQRESFWVYLPRTSSYSVHWPLSSLSYFSSFSLCSLYYEQIIKSAKKKKKKIGPSPKYPTIFYYYMRTRPHFYISFNRRFKNLLVTRILCANF
jgi:hypothetical protein